MAAWAVEVVEALEMVTMGAERRVAMGRAAETWAVAAQVTEAVQVVEVRAMGAVEGTAKVEAGARARAMGAVVAAPTAEADASVDALVAVEGQRGGGSKVGKLVAVHLGQVAEVETALGKATGQPAARVMVVAMARVVMGWVVVAATGEGVSAVR